MIQRAENNEDQNNLLFHVIGYGLLILVVFNILDIFLPPRFLDPIWEFQTIGRLVESVPVPLLALVLIFHGQANFRSGWELNVLKLLSLASLLVGLLFLLLIPLGVFNTFRINSQNKTILNTQANQQMAQLQQVENQLNQATDNDLASFLARINNRDGSPDVKNPQELKSRLITEVDNAQNTVKVQTAATQQNQRFELIKRSVKWNLGALISGSLFIRIWRASNWTREYSKRQRK